MNICIYYIVFFCISYPYNICWNSERNTLPLNVTGPVIDLYNSVVRQENIDVFHRYLQILSLAPIHSIRLPPCTMQHSEIFI